MGGFSCCLGHPLRPQTCLHPIGVIISCAHLLLHRLQQVAGHRQACVGAPVGLGQEAGAEGEGREQVVQQGVAVKQRGMGDPCS